MTRERLLCCYCGEPIRRQPRDPGDSYTQHTDVETGIERAWHMECAPTVTVGPVEITPHPSRPVGGVTIPPPVLPATSFQHALMAAKTSIAMGMALPAEEWEAFRSIVGKALEAQRPG